MKETRGQHQAFSLKIVKASFAEALPESAISDAELRLSVVSLENVICNTPNKFKVSVRNKLPIFSREEPWLFRVVQVILQWACQAFTECLGF